MSWREPAVAGLVSWWVRVYTRAAPLGEAADRRAEVASDVYDQLAAADASQARKTAAGAVVSRLLRGMPADLAWRLRVERAPGRASWHLAHPGTVLGASVLLLLPLDLIEDVVRARGTQPVLGWLEGVTQLLAALVAAFGVVALVRAAPSVKRLRRLDLRGWRATFVCAIAFLGALSGLWRFTPGPLSAVAAVAWAGFGLAVVAYVAAVLTGAAAYILDLRKVSS
jgi:hypothetical protein